MHSFYRSLLTKCISFEKMFYMVSRLKKKADVPPEACSVREKFSKMR